MPRIKDDYQRAVEIVKIYRPEISRPGNLNFQLDENRRVRKISFSKKFKPLPPETEADLLNLLREHNYQAFETTGYINRVKSSVFRTKAQNFTQNFTQSISYKAHRFYKKTKRFIKRTKRRLFKP